ncbi:hypothetical protein KD918_01715 [Acinetobacter baumannii]|uniref:hypothetical protein n=1 Tax=Acinetobacter baumannii TaxID=470 RepID=UPI001B91FCDC|nr:hypothetical protein [Acinetobacter baumannii]ELT4631729.1 hypothetical protein [Acinetobacter baumannii]MBR8588190.1 hypothetical protein [Acinetobacter baumannii]MCG5789392.1 hypothetical protein [Acinetobacter baumannii]MCJ9443290.1 hypothetical protein [Acinetobacter baumannii]MCO9044639.1 hypothetical protein [Acinetobacter baumannii]
MTKGEILQRSFVRFLLGKNFQNHEFQQIWTTFVQERPSGLNTEENFHFIYNFFERSLAKEYFILDTSHVPPRYSSAYTKRQLMKENLPEELRPSYDSIYQKVQTLKKAIKQKELEIEFLKEYSREFPKIQFEIESLIHEKEREYLALESNMNALDAIFKVFN